jgi:hypothetical protein
MMGTTGKLYEYIGSGTPIINFGPVEGDSAMFIESANAGSTFNRNEGVKAGSFLSDIYSGYKNSRMVDVSRFDRRVIAGQFAEGLKKM